MTTNHADCAHEATKAARSACRKARAAADLALNLAVDALFDAAANDAFDWISYGARRMAHVENASQYEAAVAVIRHFAPSGDEAKDDRRRRNGWTITTDARTIRSIILRAAS